jgi:hypothetical protein
MHEGMYKQAVQARVRFPFRGNISVEDLFDLDLSELNSVYKVLKREQGETEDSLLEERTEEQEFVALKLAIVLDIFETKQAEIEARKNEANRAAQKQRILEIIDNKQDEALAGKSVEELTAMINDL